MVFVCCCCHCLVYVFYYRHNVLVEFPFFHYLKALNKIEELPQRLDVYVS